MEVDIIQLQKLIYRYVTKKKPLFIHGAMGIGKSDSVRAIAKRIAKERGKDYNENSTDKNKFNLLDIRVSQLDPSDLRGIPFPEGRKTKWLIPNWLPEEGEGILFFDELNLAPPSIQAACYQLILDRRLGDYTLPKDWTILAAGNRAIDKANVFPMAAPLKNRFSHIHLRNPSSDAWIEWAMNNDIRPTIAAFIAFKPSLLFKFNPSSKDDAFPTPRTWALASYMADGISDLEDEFMTVSTCIGEGAALEYQGFVKLQKKVKVNDILRDPKKVKEITDSGELYSLISGLAEKYKNDRKNMNIILEVIYHMNKADFGVFLLRLMKAFNSKKFVEDVSKSKNWDKIYKQYNKYLL